MRRAHLRITGEPAAVVFRGDRPVGVVTAAAGAAHNASEPVVIRSWTHVTVPAPDSLESWRAPIRGPTPFRPQPARALRTEATPSREAGRAGQTARPRTGRLDLATFAVTEPDAGQAAPIGG